MALSSIFLKKKPKPKKNSRGIVNRWLCGSDTKISIAPEVASFAEPIHHSIRCSLFSSMTKKKKNKSVVPKDTNSSGTLEEIDAIFAKAKPPNPEDDKPSKHASASTKDEVRSSRTAGDQAEDIVTLPKQPAPKISGPRVMAVNSEDDFSDIRGNKKRRTR